MLLVACGSDQRWQIRAEELVESPSSSDDSGSSSGGVSSVDQETYNQADQKPQPIIIDQKQTEQTSKQEVKDDGPKMIHEDHPEHETMTEAHILKDKDPVHMDANKVQDDSMQANYRPMYNRVSFQHKSDIDAYQEFIREEEKEK